MSEMSVLSSSFENLSDRFGKIESKIDKLCDVVGEVKVFNATMQERMASGARHFDHIDERLNKVEVEITELDEVRIKYPKDHERVNLIGNDLSDVKMKTKSIEENCVLHREEDGNSKEYARKKRLAVYGLAYGSLFALLSNLIYNILTK